ncbi:MAG: type II toxin-antitoxin system VapC family toxin [Pyrinomonadaceae bacterium]
MLNLDTHILVKMLAGDLTPGESDLILNEDLAISDIVFWELSKLVQLGRIQIDLDSVLFRRALRSLTVIPVSLAIARQSTQLDFSSDPADEIIAATSVVEKVPLLTRDKKILSSRMVPFANKSYS